MTKKITNNRKEGGRTVVDTTRVRSDGSRQTVTREQGNVLSSGKLIRVTNSDGRK